MRWNCGNAPFIGWIRDLSAPDCLPIPGADVPFTDLHGIPVLVILMTLTAFVQQWISPRNPDPSQQKMMMYMPVLFSVIFMNCRRGFHSTIFLQPVRCNSAIHPQPRVQAV